MNALSAQVGTSLQVSDFATCQDLKINSFELRFFTSEVLTVIRAADVGADYTIRSEPSETVKALKAVRA